MRDDRGRHRYLQPTDNGEMMGGNSRGVLDGKVVGTKNGDAAGMHSMTSSYNIELALLVLYRAGSAGVAGTMTMTSTMSSCNVDNVEL